MLAAAESIVRRLLSYLRFAIISASSTVKVSCPGKVHVSVIGRKVLDDGSSVSSFLAAVSLWCSEVLEEDDMRDDDNEGDEATRGDEDDEATSSERGEEDDEATSSEHGEEDDEADEEGEDGNMRNDDDDEQDEEDMLTESDEEEEEEPEAPPECENCGSMEKLVMLVPCRHPCYCALCFRLAEWRTGPAGVRCPVCRVKCTRGHPQWGRLGPKPK
jgi:hypothetical protein